MCGSQLLLAMKLLEIPVKLPTYHFHHSEKYFMSCLRQSMSRREICTFEDGRSLSHHHQNTKNTSMHIQARLDIEDWKEGHVFIPKISLYKITLSIVLQQSGQTKMQ